MIQSIIHSKHYDVSKAVSFLLCLLLCILHVGTFEDYKSWKHLGFLTIILKLIFDLTNILFCNITFARSVPIKTHERKTLVIMLTSFCNLVLLGFTYSYIASFSVTNIVLDLFLSLSNLLVASYFHAKISAEMSAVFPLDNSSPPDNSASQQLTNLSILQTYPKALHSCQDIIEVIPGFIDERTMCKECPCTICFESMNNCNVYTLNCLHRFHSDCLETWVTNSIHFNCPICRTSIINLP